MDTVFISERQKEWMQEQLFRQEGPFYHLHTEPVQDRNLLDWDEERVAVLNFLALTVRRFPVNLLAYALMNNHFHLILKGSEEDCISAFEAWKVRMGRYFSRRGKNGVLASVKAGLTPIHDLKQFRDEIAYVIRNAYVVRPDVNPLGDPWCSGYLYFNKTLPLSVFPEAVLRSFRERRKLTCSRDVQIPAGLTVHQGMLRPESFVNYALVEALFPNARKFTFWVFKNIEAQIETANRLGERPILTDEDILRLSLKVCRERFQASSVDRLTEDRKKELAVILKNEYYASNGQLARFAHLPPAVISTLFPLAEKERRKP